MQPVKLKRAMELQGASWALTTEVKALPNGKKQIVRKIVDETAPVASPTLHQHVENSFFHDVKFKGHKCQRVARRHRTLISLTCVQGTAITALVWKPSPMRLRTCPRWWRSTGE
jgi:hypothetical protein